MRLRKRLTVRPPAVRSMPAKRMPTRFMQARPLALLSSVMLPFIQCRQTRGGTEANRGTVAQAGPATVRTQAPLLETVFPQAPAT